MNECNVNQLKVFKVVVEVVAYSESAAKNHVSSAMYSDATREYDIHEYVEHQRGKPEYSAAGKVVDSKEIGPISTNDVFKNFPVHEIYDDGFIEPNHDT